MPPATTATTTQLPYKFRGGNAGILDCKNIEAIVVGPAETGKTLALLVHLHKLAYQHPGAQFSIIRKKKTDLYGSVIRTFTRDILNDYGQDVQVYGGSYPQWYDYPGGSRIWLGGLDDPGKTLSSERDGIYVNQAEELNLRDWEYLTRCVTGRGAVMTDTFLRGDCNPGHPTHWIRGRAKEDKLSLFTTTHKDNPTLWNGHDWTEQGKKTRGILSNLTGSRLLRLFHGMWAISEGVIYEDWNEAIHVIEPFEIPGDWRRFRCVDFGFTNAFVCQWWALDGDGRMYLYREIYHTKRLVEDHARQIVKLSEGEHIEMTVCDHDAEDRATLERHGVPTQAAEKAVTVGIQAVQARLRTADDDKPRLFVFKGALVELDADLDLAHKPTCTQDEFAGYVWDKTPDGKPNKETPHKVDDHGMDAVRYAVMYIDNAPNWWMIEI